MRFMRWSYADLCTCPQFYLDVLTDMVQEELRDAEHKRAVADVRRGRRR